MRRRPEEHFGAPEVWIQYALWDLEAARRALVKPTLSQAVCFHCQQAAEKALKGYLITLGKADFPFTHDLREIARLISAAGGDAPPMTELRLLNRYSAHVRYPPGPPTTEAEAEEALPLAELMVAFATSRIPSAPPLPAPPAEPDGNL